MKWRNLILAIACLIGAISLSLYFNPVLESLVNPLKFGWVFGTIFIRFSVTILFVFSLYQLLLLFRSKRVKFWIAAIIGIVPGFFLSFLSVPIYYLDYGMFNDDFKLTQQTELSELTNGGFNQSNETYKVIAFFTSDCPFCKLACQKLDLNVKAGQKVPVQLIFPGTKKDTDLFLSQNNGTDFEHFRIDNDTVFLSAAGGSFPSIFLINKKGETEYHWIGDQMNYSALDYLLSLE